MKYLLINFTYEKLIICSLFCRVLVGEPVIDGEFNNIQIEEQEYILDDIFNRNNEPPNEDNDNDERENVDEGADDLDEDDGHPLYHNSPVTVRESMLLIQSLLLRHNLNMTCISDIITVIQLHCPEEGLKKNSLYKFRKYWNFNKKNEIKKHFYCSQCLRDLQHENDNCPSCPEQQSSYFVQLPIIKQLKEMYGRRDFYTQL